MIHPELRPPSRRNVTPSIYHKSAMRPRPTIFRGWSVLFVLVLVLVGLIVARRNAVQKEQKAREQAAAHEQERQKVALEQNVAQLEAERIAASRAAHMVLEKRGTPRADQSLGFRGIERYRRECICVADSVSYRR
jgi:uncharacterized protein YlxW (UPF0749 family)